MLDMLEIPIYYASKPETGHVWIDKYWVIKDDCVLFYGTMASPQCNPDKRVSEQLLKNSKMYESGCIVKKISHIYHTSCSKFIGIERKLKK